MDIRYGYCSWGTVVGGSRPATRGGGCRHSLCDPENQSAPWLNFEAGALAKKLESSRVVPLAINLKPSEVQQPLGQFQAKEATKFRDS